MTATVLTVPAYLPACPECDWRGPMTRHLDAAQTNARVHNADVDHSGGALFDLETRWPP